MAAHYMNDLAMVSALLREMHHTPARRVKPTPHFPDNASTRFAPSMGAAWAKTPVIPRRRLGTSP
jgi:hypothetical protein